MGFWRKSVFMWSPGTFGIWHWIVTFLIAQTLICQMRNVTWKNVLTFHSRSFFSAIFSLTFSNFFWFSHLISPFVVCIAHLSRSCSCSCSMLSYAIDIFARALLSGQHGLSSDGYFGMGHNMFFWHSLTVDNLVMKECMSLIQ